MDALLRPAILCLALSCLCSQAQEAGPQPGAAGAIDEALVDRLGDAEYGVRAAASAELLAGEWPTFDELIDRAVRGGIGPEQRARLISAAREKFMRSEAPGLGVSPARAADEGPVPLGTVREDLPVGGVLEVGDEIISAYGVPLRDWNHFRAVILSHAPGEAISLTFRRAAVGQGKDAILNADVVLAAYRELQTNAPVDDRARSAGFYERLSRARQMAGEQPIASVAAQGVTPLMWLEAEGLWPPPTIEVPLGETGLSAARSPEPLRLFSPGGQPSATVGFFVNTEGRTEAVIDALAGRDGDFAPWPREGVEYAVLAYKGQLDQIARVEMRFLALDARQRDAERRAADLRTQYTRLLRELGEQARIIRADHDARMAEQEG